MATHIENNHGVVYNGTGDQYNTFGAPSRQADEDDKRDDEDDD